MSVHSVIESHFENLKRGLINALRHSIEGPFPSPSMSSVINAIEANLHRALDAEMESTTDKETAVGGTDLTIAKLSDPANPQLYCDVVHMEMRDDELSMLKFGDSHRVCVQLEHGDVVTFKGIESEFVDIPF